MKFSERPSAGSGGANFIRLKDGESVQGVFRGEVTEFYKHWVGKGTIPCPGQAACALCKEGQRASFTFRLNFVTKENGIFVAKIFEQGSRVHKTLKGLNEDFELPNTIVKITRQGSSQQDTTYSVMPTKDFQVKPEVEVLLAKVQLHNLDPAAPVREDQPEPGSFDDDVSF